MQTSWLFNGIKERRKGRSKNLPAWYLQYKVFWWISGVVKCKQRSKLLAERDACLAPLLLGQRSHPYSFSITEITMEHDISAQTADISRIILMQKETLTRKHTIWKSYKHLKKHWASQLSLLLALGNLLLYPLLSFLKCRFLTLIWYKCTYYIKIRISALG